MASNDHIMKYRMPMSGCPELRLQCADFKGQETLRIKGGLWLRERFPQSLFHCFYVMTSPGKIEVDQRPNLPLKNGTRS